MDNQNYLALISDLALIQNELKINKNERNDFSNFNFWSASTIQNELKPYLYKHNLVITYDDEIIPLGNWFYAVSTAILESTVTGATLEKKGWAREDESRPKFDSPQLTGSAFSYARKRALENLFNLSSEKDSDATNNGQSDDQKSMAKAQLEGAKKHFDYDSSEFDAPPFPAKTVNTSPKTGNKYGLCSQCGLFAVSEKSMKYADDNGKDWVCFKCNEKANK